MIYEQVNCPCLIRTVYLQAFEEAELPKLKEEKPGLTHTQYKDMIWKIWKKSPDNPLNQVISLILLSFFCRSILICYLIMFIYKTSEDIQTVTNLCED